MIITPILVLHRYLGVVLGVLMTVWCLSGFVMMYQSFPATTPQEREAGLQTLDMSQCCTADLGIADDAGGTFRIEMLNGSPILRTGGRGGSQAHNLNTGATLSELTEQQVRDVATRFAAGNGGDTSLKAIETIKVDQWTAQLARRAQPLWRAKFADSHWIYVNGKSGEVIQDATLSERWLSWFGAVPHWLYPTIIRENQPLWYQSVIWLSAIGCFLTITGLVVGFVKLRSRSGKWFPYKRPMWLIHHVVGTFAGILILTWTFSGLLTMQPWGLFETKSSFDPGPINGRTTWSEARPLLEQTKAVASSGEIVRIRSAPMFSEPFAVATRRDGSEVRFGPGGDAPLDVTDLYAQLQTSGGQLATAKLDVLEREDDFYYRHKGKADLPVYRLSIADADETKVYLSPVTGEIRRVADATAKRYRWLESGLHSLDFSFMRARPVWDIITLILLAAVTVGCATGAWMSFTRIGHDWSRVSSAMRRKKPADAPAAD